MEVIVHFSSPCLLSFLTILYSVFSYFLVVWILLGLGSFSRIVVSCQDEVNGAGDVRFGFAWFIWIGPLGSCLFSLVFLLGTFMVACAKMMFFVE